MELKPFLVNWLKDRFSLDDEKSEASEVILTIEKNIYFRGTNLWVLICAILIASIGLNVNSTAVIIGAMLISPLMGPIMGVGLGLGINDGKMIRVAAYNLLLAIIIGLAVSSLYFTITPLSTAHSELLARTTPTTWDVFIALIGGLAGIIGATSKNKGNVIPGVAIATALMPPLCTAGYGIAVGNMYYFFGAIYLFLINSVFICLATYLIVRFLKFPAFVYANPETGKKIRRWIFIATIVTFIPSIYLAYIIVFNSSFQENVELFIKNEISNTGTLVVNKNINPSGRLIELTVVGRSFTKPETDSLNKLLSKYDVKDAKLIINNGAGISAQIDPAVIKSQILNDIYKNSLEVLSKKEERIIELENMLQDKNHDFPEPGLVQEIRLFSPRVLDVSVSEGYFASAQKSTAEKEILIYVKYKKPPSIQEKAKLEQWLKIRLDKTRFNLIHY